MSILEYQVKIKYEYCRSVSYRYKRRIFAIRKYRKVLRSYENLPAPKQYKLEYCVIESRPRDDWATEEAWFNEEDTNNE